MVVIISVEWMTDNKRKIFADKSVTPGHLNEAAFITKSHMNPTCFGKASASSIKCKKSEIF